MDASIIPAQRERTTAGVGTEEEPMPSAPGRGREDRQRSALVAVVTGGLVYVLGLLAVYFRPEGSTFSAWWPAAGVAVVGTAVVPGRHRALVLAAVGAGAFGANLNGDRPVLVATGFAVANVITPWVCVAMLSRGGERPSMRTPAELGRFLVATFTATTLAGVVGAAIIQLVRGEGFWITLGGFVTAHAAAVLIMVPLVLRLPDAAVPRVRLEHAAQAATLALALVLVFAPDQDLPASLLPAPLFVWAAVRMPPRWVSVELLLSGVFVSLMTTLGNGPIEAALDRGSAPETVTLLLQATLLSYALVTLPLMLVVQRHRAAVEEAERSAEVARSVLSGATGTALIGCDTQGRVEFFNAGAEQLLGYRAEEVVGTATPALWHDDLEVAARAAELGIPAGFGVFTAGVRGGLPSERRDWTFVCRDGTRLTVALRITPRYAENGRLVGWLGVGEDVTERRSAERAVREALVKEREALERLEQLDRAKTAFVSTVSHELRTPMTSVLGYTDLVLGGAAGEVTAEQKAMLEASRRNAQRLLRLIEDLLTMSRIEAGSFSVQPVAMDLRDCVAGAVDAVQPLLAERVLHLEESLGPSPLPVTGDAHQLERVVINLLSNAIKFTPDGGRITLRAGRAGETAFLEVGDTGVGIPEDEQERLFERFFRATSAHRLEAPGTGLGLAIARSVVDAHQGRISVRSRPGVGTTVRVEIPLRSAVAV